MTDYRDTTFEDRQSTVRDWAMEAALKYFASRDLDVARMGFDELNSTVPTRLWMAIPSVIRKIPDLVTMTKAGRPCFIEVKGCRETLKLKVVDLQAYAYWDKLMDLFFFIHFPSGPVSFLLNYNRAVKMIDWTTAELKAYPDNNQGYYEIPLATLAGGCESL